MAVETPGSFNQNSTYGAEQTRRTITSLLARGSSIGSITGGIVGASDLLVTAPVSGMSVNVATGEVWVPGTSSSTQGGYYGRVSSTTNLSVAAANPSNPRIDLVVAVVTDSAYSGATNTFAVAVVTGTPASSPSPPAVPTSAITLAQVAVPAAVTSITSGDITDERVLAALAVGRNGPVKPSRTLGTSYQPNAGGATLVSAIVTPGTSDMMYVYIGPTSSPTTLVARADGNGSSAQALTLTFLVPPAWYYHITDSGGGTLDGGTTIEWAL